MRARTLVAVARTVDGALRAAPGDGERVVRGVSIDSRSVTGGDVFFALSGDRADGHGFVRHALREGAAGAVVRRGALAGEQAGPLIEVDDPTRALQSLAADERARMDATVVAITGSTGKTCTKDLTAAVLGSRRRVAASPASFNNEVGLPLTLLSADETTEAVVCEMGARGRGHIRMLCEIARPHVGVVTNVGVAHMELFGSPQALRDAKAELPEAVPADGAAVLNADDPVTRGYAERTAGRVILYGTAADAEIRAGGISVDRSTGCASFVLSAPDGEAAVRLRVPGEHMVPNALAAAGVGWFLGVGAAGAAEALTGARVSPGRMEVVDGPPGVRILNDAYNANPTSMAAALRAARWMAGPGRCIAVLGVMAELGPIAVEEHERIGELLARLRIDEIVTVGEEARLIAVGAEREGVEPERIRTCRDPDEAVERLLALVRPGDLVLVKGSRVARLERVVAGLRRSGADAVTAPSGFAPGESA